MDPLSPSPSEPPMSAARVRPGVTLAAATRVFEARRDAACAALAVGDAAEAARDAARLALAEAEATVVAAVITAAEARFARDDAAYVVHCVKQANARGVTLEVSGR
jgi:hypothetical protein